MNEITLIFQRRVNQKRETESLLTTAKIISHELIISKEKLVINGKIAIGYRDEVFDFIIIACCKVTQK